VAAAGRDDGPAGHFRVTLMLRAVLALPLVVAVVATASGQFRASVDVVRMDALVSDDGRPLAGLGAADFRLTDNGQPQTIAVRPLADAEIDVVIALDTSLSVRGRRLENLRAATAALIARLTPRDRATLIAFSHELTLDPADAAPHALEARLASLTADGATSLVDATTAGLVWATGRGRPVLMIVFSDGRDTASWTRGEHALALARSSDAVVDAVVAGELASRRPGAPRVTESIPAFRSRRTQQTLSAASSTPADQTRLTSERFLFKVAELTSGRVLDGDARGLAAAFEASIAHFRSRYEITYTPTAATPGWHAIDVSVTGRRGVDVHTRRGYQR
jgi:VWFA-related protein